MKRMKKYAAFALALIMVCAMLPATALAANDYGPIYLAHGSDSGFSGFYFENCIYFDNARMAPVEDFEYAYTITLKPGSSMNAFYGDSFDEEFFEMMQYDGGAFGFFCFTKVDDIEGLYPWEFAEVNGEYYKQLSYDDYGEYTCIDYKFSITAEELFSDEVDMVLFYSDDITYYVIPEAGAKPEEPTNVTALVTDQKLEMNGEQIDIGIYNIANNNYFKLRDIAALVTGSEKQFSIGWDGELGVVSLTGGEAYEVLDSDLQPGGGANKDAVVSKAKVVLNGEVVTLAAYNIDGYTYYQLRELCQALDIAVTWNGETRTVGIDPTRGYE